MKYGLRDGIPPCPTVAPLAGRVMSETLVAVLSRPSRGAWIEMRMFMFPIVLRAVAPLAGRVD